MNVKKLAGRREDDTVDYRPSEHVAAIGRSIACVSVRQRLLDLVWDGVDTATGAARWGVHRAGLSAGVRASCRI